MFCCKSSLIFQLLMIFLQHNYSKFNAWKLDEYDTNAQAMNKAIYIPPCGNLVNLQTSIYNMPSGTKIIMFITIIILNKRIPIHLLVL